jgi:hypothetical protein
MERELGPVLESIENEQCRRGGRVAHAWHRGVVLT